MRHSFFCIDANTCGNPVAEGTVKIHRKHIDRRLGISSQGELFALFVRHAQRVPHEAPGIAIRDPELAEALSAPDVLRLSTRAG